jgi:hypothetical protein
MDGFMRVLNHDPLDGAMLNNYKIITISNQGKN